MTNFPRITVDPHQMGGVPCIRGLRIPVATILKMLAAGLSEREILTEYPDIESDDIRECFRYAAASALERELPVFRIPFEVPDRQGTAAAAGNASPCFRLRCGARPRLLAHASDEVILARAAGVEERILVSAD
jgi:uncharacterized protein (DUF433 family)